MYMNNKSDSFELAALDLNPILKVPDDDLSVAESGHQGRGFRWVPTDHKNVVRTPKNKSILEISFKLYRGFCKTI